MRTFWHELVPEFRVRYCTVAILVHLLNDLLNILICHVIASRFNESFDFVAGYAAILIDVQRIKGLKHIEHRSTLETLS